MGTSSVGCFAQKKAFVKDIRATLFGKKGCPKVDGNLETIGHGATHHNAVIETAIGFDIKLTYAAIGKLFVKEDAIGVALFSLVVQDAKTKTTSYFYKILNGLLLSRLKLSQRSPIV